MNNSSGFIIHQAQKLCLQRFMVKATSNSYPSWSAISRIVVCCLFLLVSVASLHICSMLPQKDVEILYSEYNLLKHCNLLLSNYFSSFCFYKLPVQQGKMMVLYQMMEASTSSFIMQFCNSQTAMAEFYQNHS